MNSDRDLEGKVALVTGAGSGIGRAAVELLAEEGALVGLLGRTESELEEVARGIREKQGRALVLVADVAHEGEVRRAIEQLVAQSGRLDVVFANAGVNGVWARSKSSNPRNGGTRSAST